MKQKIQGSALLFLATLIWGSAFIAQSVGMDYVGPFTFQTVRCLLAIIILIPLSAISDHRKTGLRGFTARWLDKRLWRSGIACGIPLFAAINLQQVGLLYTSATKAGFLTAMYIIIVPIIAFFMGKKLSPLVPASVAIAVSGLYLLCGTSGASISLGDALLLLSALMFAVQITVIDRCPADLDGLRLNAIQFLVCSLLSTVPMFVWEEPNIQHLRMCAVPLAYAGFLSSGIAYSLQIVGQRKLDASVASLIMSMEAVFAALCGWLILHEAMKTTEILGSVLMFAAVIISQISIKPFRQSFAKVHRRRSSAR